MLVFSISPFLVRELITVGSNVSVIMWTVVELNLAIASACAPTLGPIVNYILHHPTVPMPDSRRSRRPFRSDNRATNSLGKSKVKIFTHLSWPNLRLTKSENTTRENGFTQLDNFRGDNLNSHWTPITVPDAVEMRAMRSSNHRHGKEQEDEGLIHGIRVTTEMSQGLSKPRGA